jgi:hypothetical protein
MYNDSSCSVGVVQLSGRDFYEAVDSEVGANNAESVDSHENSSMTPSAAEPTGITTYYSLTHQQIVLCLPVQFLYEAQHKS